MQKRKSSRFNRSSWPLTVVLLAGTLLMACGDNPAISSSVPPTFAPTSVSTTSASTTRSNTSAGNIGPTTRNPTVATSVVSPPTPIPATTQSVPTQPPNAIASAQSSPIDPKKLPLGDTKISQKPQKGYIYACQTRFGGGGAERDGEWIKGQTWDSTNKLQVQGNVTWPKAAISFVLEGNTRRKVVGNGLPSHSTGTFPVAQTDPAYKYDRNPNSIREYNVMYVFPATPTEKAAPECLPMGIIGISLSGVAIFNGLDAAGRDAPAHEILDKCNGHPERDGVYHYHDLSPCLTSAAKGSGPQLIGYALDGFGIFSNIENGKEITNADLDECHGRTSEIEWDGKKIMLYHYYFTREYPYTLGCFKGNVSKP